MLDAIQIDGVALLPLGIERIIRIGVRIFLRIDVTRFRTGVHAEHGFGVVGGHGQTLASETGRTAHHVLPVDGLVGGGFKLIEIDRFPRVGLQGPAIGHVPGLLVAGHRGQRIIDIGIRIFCRVAVTRSFGTFIAKR